MSALGDAYPRPCDFVCWSRSSAARTKSGAASDQSSRQKTSTVESSGDATKCALACAPSIAPYGTELFDPFGRRTSARLSLSSMNVAITRHNCPGSTAATLSWAASARLPVQHRQRDPRHGRALARIAQSAYVCSACPDDSGQPPPPPLPSTADGARLSVPARRALLGLGRRPSHVGRPIPRVSRLSALTPRCRRATGRLPARRGRAPRREAGGQPRRWVWVSSPAAGRGA